MINFYDGQVIPEADATVDVVAFFFPAPSRGACGALNPPCHQTCHQSQPVYVSGC